MVRWWEWLYLIFPALKQVSTSIESHYSCQDWILAHSRYWNTPVKRPQDHHDFIWGSQQWKMSPQASQPVQVSKLNFSTFLVPIHTYLTSAGPPRQWKQVYLIFQSLKQESTIITQPLQLWKLNFRTFLVLKHACPTSISTVVKTRS